jgi:hypothetical protein
MHPMHPISSLGVATGVSDSPASGSSGGLVLWPHYWGGNACDTSDSIALSTIPLTILRTIFLRYGNKVAHGLEWE